MTVGCEIDNHWKDYHFAARRSPMTITDAQGKHIDVTAFNRMYNNRELRNGDTILLKGLIPIHFDYRGCHGILLGNVNCIWIGDATVDSLFEHRIGDSIFLSGILGIDYTIYSGGNVSFSLFVIDNNTIYMEPNGK